MPIENPSSKMFNVTDVTGFLDNIATALNQEAAAKKETLQVEQQQRSAITDAAAEYAGHAQNALSEVETIQAQGDEARRLANGNIIDRVTLIGEQILNPGAYTSAGRNKRINEVQAVLGMQGAATNAKLGVAESKIAEARIQEQLATLGINTQMTALRTQVEAVSLMNRANAETEGLRQTNLIQMDPLMIDRTLNGPSQNGKYTINGMPYTQTELLERKNALEVRADLALMSPIDTDPDYAMKLSAQQRRTMATMTSIELEQVRNNGYVMPDGKPVIPSVWDQEYNRANQMERERIETGINRTRLENQIPVMLQEQSRLIDTMGPQVVPGSELGTAFSVYRAQIEAISQSAAKDQSTEARVIQATQIEQARGQLYQFVEKESLKKALGDKKLASIYQDQMLGIQTDPGVVQDFIVERYVGGKGFSEVLPNKASGLILKRADINFAKMQQEQATQLYSGKPELGKKEMKEAAMRLAFEQESGNLATSAVNTIQMGMLHREDHPARKAGMVYGQLAQMQSTALGESIRKVMRDEGITSQQIQAIMDGRHDEANLPEAKISEIGQRINAEATFQEYMLYEKQKQGLGYEVVQWYNNTLPTVARNYSANLTQGERALAGDAVVTESQKLSDLWSNADEMFTGRGDAMAVEVATGAKKPENMWPVLLQTSDNLTDSQRQSIYYDILMPAMTQARAMEMDDGQVMQATLNAINVYKSEDKQLMAAVRTFDRQMPKAIDNFNTNWNFMMSQRVQNTNARPSNYLRMDLLPAENQLRVQQVIPWLKTEQLTQFEDTLRQQSPLSGLQSTGDPSKIGGLPGGNAAAIGGQAGGNAPQPNRAIPPAQTRPSLPNQNWPFGAR